MNSRRFVLTACGLIILVHMIAPNRAQAYIDPGTSSSIFTVLSSFIPGLAVVGAVLFYPFKRFFGWLKQKLARHRA